ncbi:MAG: glycosyltransferase [Flavobacteriaceae bacterium]
MRNFIALICHYNDPEGLEKSLLSIQEDFPVDVLVVDDGSAIKPDLERLESLYKNGKIFLELLHENVGVGEASNLGLKR